MGYAFNPDGSWTSQHQMSVNGKFDGITRADLQAFASANGVKDGAELIDQVCDAAARWPEMALEIGVPDEMIKAIVGNIQLSI